ncbi:4836_t:CDS:1, partial [Funneliformis caledonium]
FPDSEVSIQYHYFSNSSFCFSSDSYTCLKFFRDEPQNNCFQLFSNISGSSY